MKQNTVIDTFNDYMDLINSESSLGRIRGSIWLAAFADMRWVNCYGEILGDNSALKLHTGSKILGD